MSEQAQTERGYVYRGHLPDAAALGARLAAWFPEPRSAYQLTFREDACGLAWFDPAQAEAAARRWTEGRVFSALREARWQAGLDGYAVWLLAEAGNLPQDLDGLRPVEAGAAGWEVVARTEREHAIYLWGLYDAREGAWIEVRIPDALRYPVDPGEAVERQPVRVGHVDYLAPNGAAQFVRWTEVI